MGFCLFNNIAVAAAHAVAELGLERILIVDWDVHHGNGTQEMFFDDPRVLFFSMHLGRHYPGTGSLSEIGAGEGVGYTGNLPLEHGSGDAVASLFFSRVVEPVAREFGPQLVLVSAGFDSSAGDPLGGLTLSRAAFRWMSGRLTELCRTTGAVGPICFLEGGYDVGLLSAGIVATIEGFSSGPGTLDVAASAPEAAAVELLARGLAPYWSSLTV
jgi:acetoin utilization deacetylase AcuC-like enzyme